MRGVQRDVCTPTSHRTNVSARAMTIGRSVFLSLSYAAPFFFFCQRGAQTARLGSAQAHFGTISGQERRPDTLRRQQRHRRKEILF